MRLGVVWVALCVMALAVTVLLLVAKAKSKTLGGATRRFKAKTFMTPNELEFLERLETAAPELRFHAQVAMGALLTTETPKRENAREHMSSRNMFSQKIVDFVAQRKSTGEVVAVIELDDRTHNLANDESRDAMLREANYKIVRWQSKSKPDGPAIREALLAPKEEAVDGNARLGLRSRRNASVRD